MFKTSVGILGFCALLSVAGCAPWTKPGATPEQRHAALAECQAMAYQKLPALMQPVEISPPQTVPPEMNCTTDKGRQSCSMTPGSYAPPVYANEDQNQSGRDAIVADCMYRQGWTR
jgi:hypothetical protein